MAAKKTKKMEPVKTKEEMVKDEIEFQKNYIKDSIRFLNAPSYEFSTGTKVSVGNLKNATVYEKLYDGKAYLIESETDNGSIQYSAHIWTSVRPCPLSNEKEFLKNEDIRLSFHSGTIRSLLNSYYMFGIDMDPGYQRDYVWSKEDEENLIKSIFENINIGRFVLIANDNNEKYYEILDGKQRINTIIKFYENRMMYQGKYFNDLSSKDRNAFIEKNIEITELRNLSEELKLRYFILLNTKGRAMSKKDLERAEKLYETVKNKEL